MQPESHYSLVVECLKGIQSDHRQNASSFLKAYFQQNRNIGSRERRAITEDVYAVLRAWCGWQAVAPDLTPLQAVWHYAGRDLDLGPDALCVDLPKKGSLEPSLLKGRFGTGFWEKMSREAPWDLRVNPLIISRDRAWKQLLKTYPDMTITSWSPLGLRLPKQQAPQGHLKDMLAAGALEVQDEGSQLIGLLCDVGPDMRVWDACAGAGGKTLVLGAMMQNSGYLVASDVDVSRLQKAQARMQKAGLFRAQYQLWQHVKQTFDRVLVDGPCSGTGTWRRHPELAMRFKMPDTSKLPMLLKDASTRVKKGGWLIYATCSFLREENQDVVEVFLKDHPDFELSDMAPIWRRVLGIPYPATTPWLQLTPQDHYTDGFFIAIMQRK